LNELKEKKPPLFMMALKIVWDKFDLDFSGWFEENEFVGALV